MVVERNGLSKRAKIPGLKPNELFNAENGGAKKNHKLGTRDKRTYDDDESEMKLKSGLKKKRVFGNNGNKVRVLPSVSSRTMWHGSTQLDDKPSSRNLKPKSVAKSSDSSKVVTFTSSSRRESGDKRRFSEESVGVDDKPMKARRVIRIGRGDVSSKSAGKFSNASKVGGFSSSSRRAVGNKRRVSEEGLDDKPMKAKRFIRTDRGDISSKSVGKFSNSSKVGTFSSLSKRAIGYKRKISQEAVNVDDKPMKTKRVIRIDRGDISNKRIFDDIGDNNDNDKVQEKRNDSEEKNIEMSKNAQFRAIKPSASILSYVEDNLLGRRRLIELRRAGYNTELSAPLDNIPNSTSTERERVEDSVFRNKLEFFAAAKVSLSFPPPELPEIAFAGRSNVGKSSLLNSLTRQWGVARTSDKPGLTQTINFFNLGTKLCLVDLPGYGFTYAKEEVKDSWEELVKEYVSTRDGLKRVCLLVDTKWGMKPRDHELIDLMERAKTKYQIILTKTDLVFPIDVARRAMQIEEKLKAHKSVVQPVVMISSKSGAGIRSLRTVLTKIGRLVKL